MVALFSSLKKAAGTTKTSLRQRRKPKHKFKPCKKRGAVKKQSKTKPKTRTKKARF